MSSLLALFRLFSFLAVLGLVAAPAATSLAAQGEPVAVAVHHDGAHGETGAPHPASPQPPHCPPAMACAVKCVTSFSMAAGPVQQGLDLAAVFLPADDPLREPFGPSPLPRPPKA